MYNQVVCKHILSSNLVKQYFFFNLLNRKIEMVKSDVK